MTNSELRERLNENNRRWFKKNPWVKSYYGARGRCESGKYKGRIKFLMTIKEFKFLWNRDKAWLLKEPSIDRIDNKDNYILDNCRFIELSENSRLGNLGRHHSKETKEKMRAKKKGKSWTLARRLAEEKRGINGKY